MPLRVLYCLYAFVLFAAGLLLVFPGVMVALLLGQPAAGNLVIHLSRFWSNMWLAGIGIWHKNIVLQPINPQSHYVFVANHISYLDIPVIFKAIPKNNIRVLGKKEMARIPVFGLLYRLAVILVDRSSTENRAKSLKTLRKMLDQNICIFIFPEGTFNESGQPLKAFYDGAFRTAIETQTPIKPLVFLDTHRLMHYRSLLMLRPGVNRCVILPQVEVAGLTMEQLPQLKAQVYAAMEQCLLQYPLA